MTDGMRPAPPRLVAGVDDTDPQRIRVLAPSVGWWCEHPPSGRVVGPGSPVGRLRVLNRQYLLILPDGIAGTVETGDGPSRRAVGFEDPLFVLHPLAAGGMASAAAAASTGARSTLAAGTHGVIAPTDGVFYRRPTPDAVPFVEVGARVRTGQPVGLVEVMKTFNQIVYGGPGLPAEAEVLEVCCEDGAEISAGQLLLVVR